MKEVKTSLKSNELAMYVANQFSNFFPDNFRKASNFNTLVNNALERSLFCFSHVNQKHFSNSEEVFFNHLNGDQYATFLYYLSNEGFINHVEEVYIKSAYLNKALHGIDLFGHIKMPNTFLLVHPVGTIVGRAIFEEKLVIYQGVTIGGKHKADGGIDYPKLSENTVIYSNATIIGNTELSKNSVVASEAFISNLRLTEPNKIIVGHYPNNGIKDILKFKEFFF